MIEKIEKIEVPDGNENSPKFRFQPAPRSGKEVVVVDDITHSYGNEILFLGANLQVERGEIIAFVGSNGSGNQLCLDY